MEEIQFVDQYFLDIENTEASRKEKIEAIKKKGDDFFEPVLHPGEQVDPKKWVNILLLIMAVQYGWSVLLTARQDINFFQCDQCGFEPVIFFELGSLVYIPVIFFLLFKRKRWGWILLFADNLFSMITSVSQSYVFFKYQHVFHGNAAGFLFHILIKAAFVFFLWRGAIAKYFGVERSTKQNTALITLWGTIVFILIVYIIY